MNGVSLSNSVVLWKRSDVPGEEGGRLRGRAESRAEVNGDTGDMAAQERLPRLGRNCGVDSIVGAYREKVHSAAKSVQPRQHRL